MTGIQCRSTEGMRVGLRPLPRAIKSILQNIEIGTEEEYE